ncbi:MAG: PP2C family serine/threonine-protein phosphatase [Actinomycetota bacterium]
MVATRWRLITASCRGSAHEHSGQPNQDAVGYLPPGEEGSSVVMAVSDGHGDGSCYRSDVGARLAVDIATELGAGFLAALGEGDGPKLGSVASEVLAPNMVRTWQEQVYLHSGEQYRVSSTDEPDEVLIPYGATLLVAMLAETCGVILQLGDGDVLLVAGGSVHVPMPPDVRSTANHTTSLCLPDAGRSFRMVVLDEPLLPDLVLLASDGYGNSFQDPNWQEAVGTDLINHHREHGAGWIQDQLPEWLAESALVGGDDVTLAIAVRDCATHWQNGR